MEDIERLKKSHPERIAMNRQQVVQAEENLRCAKELLSYEENIVPQKIQSLHNDLPRGFFAPAIAIWRLLLDTTESLCEPANVKTSKKLNAQSDLAPAELLKNS